MLCSCFSLIGSDRKRRTRIITKPGKMSYHRYFQNRFPDYNPNIPFERPKEEWHNQIMAIVQQVVHASQYQMSSDGGLYVGSAGIAYMLYYVSEYEHLNQYRDSLLKTALDIISRDLRFAERTAIGPEQVSFILGPSGIYTTAAMVGKALNKESMVKDNIKKFQSIATHCTVRDFLRCGSDELFVGRAGYLCGMQSLEKNLKTKILSDEVVNSICQAMIDSGQEYSTRHKSNAPLMYTYYDTEYLGAAHGVSSILQTILCCPSFYTSPESNTNLVKAAVDWLLSIQQPDGNFVPTLPELKMARPEHEELVHWCHGGPGVVYLFARAYQLWKTPAYLDACLKCGELAWQKGLLRKGAGICHGVSGSGYVFLLLYRLTQDKKHLYRAHKFAEFMFTPEFRQGSRTPDCPFSLYEGWAGAVCFLIDLLQPDKAEFPFFSVI